MAMPVTTAEFRERQRAVFGRASDDVLFGAVAQLELKADSGVPLTVEETMVRAWILGEVEARYPEVDAAMDRWAEGDAAARTYSACLFAEVGRVKAERAARGAAMRVERFRAGLAASRERAARVRALGERYPGRVRLRGVGVVPAIPAGDVRPGDVLMFNGGAVEVVTGVVARGSASVVVRTGPADWQARTCRRVTLVAVADRPGDVV